MQPLFKAAFALCVILCVRDVHAEQVTVAVAANFAKVAQQLKSEFEARTDHTLRISIGSTGALYAQIKSGAPFDVLLAGDQLRPQRLQQEGTAIKESRFTYAIGQLVLWSADPRFISGNGVDTLKRADFNKLAIANPRVAPYGKAAEETLKALEVWDFVSSKLVFGENIGQTHAMVATGNARAGLVALSYVLSIAEAQPGSRWDVPRNLYTPIRQDAILLTRAKGNEAAQAFLQTLQSDWAQAIIEQHGYLVEQNP